MFQMEGSFNLEILLYSRHPPPPTPGGSLFFVSRESLVKGSPPGPFYFSGHRYPTLLGTPARYPEERAGRLPSAGESDRAHGQEHRETPPHMPFHTGPGKTADSWNLRFSLALGGTRTPKFPNSTQPSTDSESTKDFPEIHLTGQCHQPPLLSVDCRPPAYPVSGGTRSMYPGGGRGRLELLRESVGHSFPLPSPS